MDEWGQVNKKILLNISSNISIILTLSIPRVDIELI